MKRININITEETYEKFKAQELSQREVFVRGLLFTSKYQNIELPRLKKDLEELHLKLKFLQDRIDNKFRDVWHYINK